MLNLFQIATIFSLTVNLLLGIIVYHMNPSRRANRYFLVTSIVLNIWFVFMLVGSPARDSVWRLFCVRQAHAFSLALPLAFDLLRLSIAHSELSCRQMLKQSRALILVLALGIVFSQMPSFVVATRVVDNGFLMPVFGALRPGYPVVWIVGMTILISGFRRDLRETTGIERTELQFILLGAILAVIAGLSLGHFIPMATDNAEVIQLLPLCAVVLDGVIAYGIATRRIMSVGHVLRQATAYVLLICYLVLLYATSFAAIRYALSQMTAYASGVAHLMSALVVALSMAPAHGWMQRFATRLFISLHPMDMHSTMQDAHRALLSIGTTSELLDRFAGLVRKAAGTDRIAILARGADHVFRQVYPTAAGNEAQDLRVTDPVPRMLSEHRDPLAYDAVSRLRPTPQVSAVMEELRRLQATIAIGFHAKGSLSGILLLGRRLSGRIYGAEEQAALQFFCDQLGIALENARLYTEVQNSKIYNEILLDSLVSGVIALGADQKITVFNREAQRITGLPAEGILGQRCDALPKPLADVVKSTLESGAGTWDEDLDITRNGDEAIPIRISSSGFHGHTGEPLGVLVVINDMSLVKKLEEQVRRTDRLASLGTLSAGMAHEIKNPLVSIKTFTQLLPERYEDSEFRETFTRLIGQEVIRIDSIVNRLLHFARPAKATLTLMHLHPAMDETLRLIDQQLRRYSITLVRRLEAPLDLIQGDTNLLNQTFINFLLNAIEAMKPGGTLTVVTSTIEPQWLVPLDGRRQRRACIRVSITDTGHGIPSADVTRIFDPFFTTKSNGTGLGLSVAHGIIQEHGATVDVESEVGKGTTFHIAFPLVVETDQQESGG